MNEVRDLWSVRMHASVQEAGELLHASGAERLVEKSSIATVVAQMLERAQAKDPSKLQITVEQLSEQPCAETKCLPVTTVTTQTPQAAQTFAIELLTQAGVCEQVAYVAFDSLIAGLGTNGSPLRGASLWDYHTGKRLEPDLDRGVRATRFDYSPSGSEAADRALAQFNLTHFRTKEALAVATKTLWSGVLAELCWSDEPEYLAGYVATVGDGYVRIPDFKPARAKGGRIFFIDSERTDIEATIQKLENSFLLINPPVVINETVTANEYFRNR